MFYLSKILSAITQPIFWLALLWLLALLLQRLRKLSLSMLWAGLLLLGLLGFQSLPEALLRPLENRYPVPTTAELERSVGLVVLGGAIEHPDSYLVHGQVPLGESAERMTVPVALLRQYPRLELVFAGGEGRLFATGTTEADLARRFYQQQGLDLAKIHFENGSRNTRENAEEVAKLLGRRCHEPWLLVTSAWHMPRAMAEFAAAGCPMTAYPVDFRSGDAIRLGDYSLAHSLTLWQTALHEWLGGFVHQWRR